MKFKPELSLAFLMLFLLSAGAAFAAQAPQAEPEGQGLTQNQIIDRFIARERELMVRMKRFQPMVETYIQNLDIDEQLGAVPKGDKYFLGKLDLSQGISQNSLLPQPGLGSKLLNKVTQLWSVKYLPNGFAQMIFIDSSYFGRDHYDFEYVRREFLGEVRTLVYDVQPSPSSDKGSFWGRIWVEDKDFTIVRFNGAYGPNLGSNLYFHFDSWRENMNADLWLPAYVYSEESNMPYLLGRRSLRFKGQTRLWGYNTIRPDSANEFTDIRIDQVNDNFEEDVTSTPVARQRAWERQAEDNILRRMQKAGLLAPPNEVDKVLETVMTNLEVTNDLNLQPGVRARVLLTSPLESLTVGRTVILSSGLVDVLPDEASLAAVLAHELAHIALGHQLDTKYSFSDRMLFSDDETFRSLFVKRNEKEEIEADKKAAELLNNSPYRDKLTNAGLFLRAIHDRADQLTHLLKPHMGNFIARDSKVRLTDLMEGAPQLDKTSLEQIAALPLGGRIRLNPWNNRIELVKAAPVPLFHAREKMPFEVTPVNLHLTRSQSATGDAAKNNN